MVDPNIESLKYFGDGVAATLAVLIVSGVIPGLVGIATLVYTCIRIYETRTIQDWIKGRKNGSDR